MAFATGGEMLSKFTPFAFITGGVFSMLAGFIGMKIATNSNARTAQAAYEGLNKGLRVAFSSGSVMGFTVVGLGMHRGNFTARPKRLTGAQIASSGNLISFHFALTSSFPVVQ